MDLLVFDAIDLLGTIVFAISGAIVGIRQKLDMFGVMMTALMTATGGGAHWSWGRNTTRFIQWY